MSKSQEKRNKRREEIENAKKQAKRDNFIGTAIIVLVCAIFLGGIGSFVYYKMTQTTPSSDFGAQLNDNGTIKNVTPADYITVPDYKNITASLSELEYSDAQVAEDVAAELMKHKTASTDSAMEAADGDTLNIDYVGTIDGVPFEGGSTDGKGTDLTLGSGKYIDNFEEQLIGSHPGDKVAVNVTFPEEYTDETLQGKAAVFDVTVNSIYVLPEFDDAFVAENLSEYATTAEGYREYLKTTNYEANLRAFAANYLLENSAATSYSNAHVKYLMAIGKYQQEDYYKMYNQMTQMYTGAPAYNSFSEYTGMTTSEFEAYLKEEAQKRAALDMTYQYIFETEGLSVPEDAYVAKTIQLGADSTDLFGEAYIRQMLIQDAVIEYLAGVITVE